ncbi:hypothetical protein EDD18DRAFT_1342417 [Armillaria luteobubalina]|uniref:Uncharacterized protein n=1 Tax=Armillaria luteobubalina TaxID=153913 RepID=A0AA39QQ67_9AGAR|nr:hypothetical protein EDD18DRAFT_1342417 [Armillaria luteobubalina]
MPVQILQLALRVILFVSLSSVLVPHIYVLASPSMPLALMNYARSGPQSMADFSKRNDTLLPYRDVTSDSILDIGDNSSNLGECNELLVQLTVGVLNFSKRPLTIVTDSLLISTPSGKLVNDESLEKDRPNDYQDSCVAGLNNCKGILGELNLAIAALPRGRDDKGLGNYDRNDRLETVLKDTVNQTKDLLKVTVILVNKVPIVGPIIGPTVDELKCIIDEILDAAEDITDGLLNSLGLKLLVSSCTGGVLGIAILGICI